MATNGEQQEPTAGTTAREHFAGQELQVIGETAASAVAEQARALVEARFIMALKRPRDWDDVRVRLLKECKRPSLAEVAIYSKPVGDKAITGLSIRFVEMALRVMGNVVAEKMTVYDSPAKRVCRITITDLEANTSYPTDVTIEKVVERSGLTDGRIPISSRKNTRGRMVYLVPATEDELLNKENALTSKAIRTNGLRIIPGDLQDEAEHELRATMSRKDAEDPDSARRKLADAFAALSVLPAELAKFLGHDLGTASPAELQELRAVYAAIRDGESNWPDALAAKLGTGESETETSDPKKQALKEKLDARRAEKPATESAATSTAPGTESSRPPNGRLVGLIAEANGLIAEVDTKTGKGDQIFRGIVQGEKLLDECDEPTLNRLIAALKVALAPSPKAAEKPKAPAAGANLFGKE
jgi:hypothetical protein